MRIPPLLGAALSLLVAETASTALAAWPTNSDINVPICCSAAKGQSTPRVVTDLTGGAYIVWADGARSGIYSQRVLNSGDLAWSTGGVALCDAPTDLYLSVAISDGAGGAIAVWQDYRSGTPAVYIQRIDAAGVPQWTPNGVYVGQHPGGASLPLIVSDGASGVIVIWPYIWAGAYGVSAQRFSASGGALWATPVALNNAPSSPQQIRAASDGMGGAVVAWTDQHQSPPHAIKVQRIDANGALVWGAAARTMRDGLSDPFANAAILGDGAGGAFVAWSDLTSGPYKVYAQRLSPVGEPMWASPGVLLDTSRSGTSSTFRTEQVLVPADNGVIVGWRIYRPAANSRQFGCAQHLDASGAELWNPGGVVFTDEGVAGLSGTQDQFGGAVFAWEAPRDTMPPMFLTDIYANRVDASGAIWTSRAVPIGTASGYQYEAALAPDGTGGALIAWTDGRAGSNAWQIYAQRVQADGSLGPDLTGVPEPVPSNLGMSVIPNPARASGVRIRYVLPADAETRLSIFDTGGRRVAERFSGRRVSGEHSLEWNARDADGHRVPPGIYLARIDAGNRSAQRRIVLLP